MDEDEEAKRDMGCLGLNIPFLDLVCIEWSVETCGDDVIEEREDTGKHGGGGAEAETNDGECEGTVLEEVEKEDSDKGIEVVVSRMGGTGTNTTISSNSVSEIGKVGAIEVD